MLSKDVEEKHCARFEGLTNYSWWDRKGQLNCWRTDARTHGRAENRTPMSHHASRCDNNPINLLLSQQNNHAALWEKLKTSKTLILHCIKLHELNESEITHWFKNKVKLHINVIKVKKDCLWKHRTHKITKIGDSVWLSLFICNTIVCEAAYASYRRRKRYSNNQDGLNDPKEKKYNLHMKWHRNATLWCIYVALVSHLALRHKTL